MHSHPLHGHVEHFVVGGEGGGVDKLLVVEGIRLHHDGRDGFWKGSENGKTVVEVWLGLLEGLSVLSGG